LIQESNNQNTWRVVLYNSTGDSVSGRKMTKINSVGSKTQCVIDAFRMTKSNS